MQLPSTAVSEIESQNWPPPFRLSSDFSVVRFYRYVGVGESHFRDNPWESRETGSLIRIVTPTHRGGEKVPSHPRVNVILVCGDVGPFDGNLK